jgi:hypothetical protein
MILYAVASVVFAVQTPRRLRALSLAACPGAVAALLAAVYAVRSEPLKGGAIRAVAWMTLSPWEKVTSLPGALFSAGRASAPMLLASVVAMALLSRDRAKDRAAPRGVLARLADARVAILAAILLALYFAMPLTLSGSTLIHQRFLAPAFAMAVLSVAPRSGRSPRWAPVLVGFPVAIVSATLGGFVDQDRSYRDLDVVLARMEDGAAVAQLDLTPRAASAEAPVIGPASRALAVHGGRLLFSFAEAPSCPVSIPRRYDWSEPALRLAPTPFAFMPSHDLLRFRYVLVYELSPAMEGPLVTAFAPEGRFVVKAGRWLLFESTLPLLPLTAEDEPLPSPAPEPLAERVRRALPRR